MESTKELNLTQKLSEEEITELKTMFGLLDLNKDGRVNASELQQMLQKLGITAKEDILQELIKQASPTGSTLINETEFLQWMSALPSGTDKKEEARQDLLAAFRVFDRDTNGYITKDELIQAMETIGESLTEREINELLKLADIDCDGRINYEEFITMLL